MANRDCIPEQFAAAGDQGTSMWLVAIRVQHRRYEEVDHGDETSLIWNPLLEAKPRHLRIAFPP